MVDYCALTLDVLDPEGEPVTNGALGVMPWKTAFIPEGVIVGGEKFYALSYRDGQHNVEHFVRGVVYRWREYKPKGRTFWAYCPDVPAADYSDLVEVDPTSLNPVVVPEAAWWLELNEQLGVKLDRTAIDRDRLGAAEFTKWRPLFAALENRNTAKVDIGVMGPSTVAGYLTTWASTIPQALTRRLRQRFPVDGLAPSQGGTGAIPVPDEAVRGETAVASPTTTPWQFNDMLFDETALASGLNHTVAYTAALGYGYFTTDRDLTSVKISHVVGNLGLANTAFLKAGALPPVLFTTYAAATAVKEDTATAVQLGFPGGVIPAGTVILTGATGTGGYFILSHAECFYNDETKGIHVHNIGHSGYDTTQWQATGINTTTRATIAALNLDFLVLAFYGANAAAAGKTAAQWKTDMVAHVAWLRAGGVACNILLVGGSDPVPALTLPNPWSAYVKAMQEISAADATVAFKDLSLRMPNTSAAATYGLYAPDKVHLTDRGNQVVSDEVVDYMLSMVEGGPVGEALGRKADLVNGVLPSVQVPWAEVAAKQLTASATDSVVTWSAGMPATETLTTDLGALVKTYHYDGSGNPVTCDWNMPAPLDDLVETFTYDGSGNPTGSTFSEA